MISRRTPTANKLRGGVYVIVDPDHCGGRDASAIAKATAAAGASAIQLRHKDTPKSIIVEEARRIAEICKDYGTLFIVNDYPDIALEVAADGVHVGQGDMSVADCRDILKAEQIVGKSNALLEEALDSLNEGADYIAVGAIYNTSTKSNTRPAGLATLKSVASRVSVPIVAIGGINADNITPVIEAGADCVCVATAITLAPDPAQATRELTDHFPSVRN